MSIVYRAFLISSVALYVMILIGCEKTSLAGNDAETGNPGISGKFLGEEGEAEAGVVVKLIPSNYNPLFNTELPKEWVDTTDKNGSYSFTISNSGLFNIIAMKPESALGVFVRNIGYLQQDVEVSPQRIGPMGYIKLFWYGEEDVGDAQIYLLGTDMVWNGELSIQNPLIVGPVPVASYAELRSVFNEQDIRHTENIEVVSEDTVSIPLNGEWSQSMQIRVNTTNSGVLISENILNFPLLLRLDASNFDFSLSQSNGGDLRIINSNNKLLPIQIEEWDLDNRLGIVWVHMDTIFADHLDSLTIYWGNETAQSVSNGELVFARDEGWVGVWHLNEEAGGMNQDIYRNSVEDLHHADDYVNSVVKEGVIGKGQYFELPDYIQVSNASSSLKPSRQLMVSAWVCPDSLERGGGAIASMGDNYNLRVGGSGGLRFSLFDSTVIAFVEDSVTIFPLVQTGWHHVVGVYDGQALTSYVDGNKIGEAPYIDTIPYTNSPHFIMGVHGNGQQEFDFKGAMDEVRVSNVPRTQEWVRLEFENQRMDSRLIEY